MMLCRCYETEFEFRSLMAWGKKLLLSLSIFAIMLLKRLPDGSEMKKWLQNGEAREVGGAWWMQRSCLCFTSSRISLTESTHLFCGSVSFQIFFFWASHLYLYSAFNNTNCNKALHNIKIGKSARDWYLRRFYVERVTAHRIKINDRSCFHNLWPNSKWN